MPQAKHLITTLSLGAATLALALGAAAQPLRTAAAEPAVPASTPSRAAPTAAPAATTAPAAAAPATVAIAAPPPERTSDGIAVTVGNNSISDFELDQRVALFFATAGFKPTAEDRKRVRKIQMDQLIDEHVQQAEANRRRITVSPVEVDKRLDAFVKDHNTTVKELSDLLLKAGTSIDVLRTQITMSIAWGKVVVSEFGDQVVVTPAMIDDTLRRDAEGASKTHYRVMEIFLPVDNTGDAAKEAAVKKEIDDLDAKVRAGSGLFRNLAQEYSRDPSAAAGGDIGWVYDGQLDADLNAALAKMATGELSHPIRAKGGWYLLGLQDRREPLGTDVKAPEPEPTGPAGTLPLARLLLPLPPNTPKATSDNILRNAVQIRNAATSCEILQTLSQDPQLKGSIFMSLGNYKLTDASEQMQKALAETKAGEATMPFLSPAGVEIIARCDKHAPPPRQVFELPKREEVENDLFQEQIAALARRFMRDLKRDANIQERNDNAVMDAALIQ